MNTKLAHRGNDTSRSFVGREFFTQTDALLDRGFDEMIQFGLHDEHDVRSIMELPTHTKEVKHYG
jgi:S-adenosylmethionine hydrolase